MLSRLSSRIKIEREGGKERGGEKDQEEVEHERESELPIEFRLTRIIRLDPSV